MRTIYLDTNYMCHALNDGGMQAVETSIFDALCDGAIECYRFIPAGQTWQRPDGRILHGLFVQAVASPDAVQRQYNADNTARLNDLGIPLENGFTASRNYPVESFFGIYGDLYEVISAIPCNTSIILGQNVIKTTVEHYLDTLKEGE